MEAPIVIRKTDCYDDENMKAIMAIEKIVFGKESLDKNQLSACGLRVASVLDRMVGYIATLQNVHNSSVIIESIVVLPEWQGQGVGSQLMDMVISECYKRNIYKISLMARVENTTAINFYKKKGFAITSSLKNYYGAYNPFEKKGDAYCMVRLNF
jgi:ribosomal protein S18 acetylase RimI-like enzyme